MAPSQVTEALPPIAFDLSEPGSVLYSGQLAAMGMRINRFAQGMKAVANREAFRADPAGYLAAADLSEEERARIEARDYAWLLSQGGHIQALQRIATVDGFYLFHVAAPLIGADPEVLRAACPRRVSGLGGLDG